jgi:hypothetical protein
MGKIDSKIVEEGKKGEKEMYWRIAMVKVED